MKFQGIVKVLDKIEIMEDVFQITAERPAGMEGVKPGQFFNFKADNVLLRRPISISGINETTLEFTIKIVGQGTASLRAMTEIDMMGPLGNGYDLIETGKALVVGGGIGTAPMKALACALAQSGVVVDTIIGFREKPYLEDAFESVSDKLIIVSETDAAYVRGYVTAPMETLLKSNTYDMVYVCGPTVMLKNVQKICQDAQIKVQLLMEEKMACGIGACLVCTCKTKQGEFGFKHSRMCVDGPMFYGDEVIFDA